MPFSDPDPAASPLLVGALMPPLVPPALEVMIERCHHAHIAGVVGFRLILREFIQIDLIPQRGQIVHAREQTALRRP